MTIQEQLLCAILDCDETELSEFINLLRLNKVDIAQLIQDTKQRGLEPSNLEDLKTSLYITHEN